MPDSDKTQKLPTLIVVAYDPKILSAFTTSLASFPYNVVTCSCFREAEEFVLQTPITGVLVDLATMIKSKGEEKLIGYMLTGFFPALRVKAMGSMLVPMTMSGDAKQDKSLHDFLTKTCAGFTPRRLRTCKRRDICMPACIGPERGFTMTISWAGIFIANMHPERFTKGNRISVHFPDFELDVACIVTRIQAWGQHRPPGIGLNFVDPTPELEEHLLKLLKASKACDRDRIVV